MMNQLFFRALDRSDGFSAVSAILRRFTPCYLSTIGLDGAPQVRPVALRLVRDGGFYFTVSRADRLYAELSRDARVSLCVYDSETDTCLRLSGKTHLSEDVGLAADCGADAKTHSVFFLLGASAVLTSSCEEIGNDEWLLPDPQGVLIGITIKKDTELRDRIAKVLDRRAAETPNKEEDLFLKKLYDGALVYFAENAKALWPRMNIQPLEAALLYETYDAREEFTSLAARLIGNAVIDKPEDISYWLNKETLRALYEKSKK